MKLAFCLVLLTAMGWALSHVEPCRFTRPARRSHGT